MTQFDGFSADALAFLEEIGDNNNKAWFEANKPRFKKQVQKPAQDLVVAMGERLDEIRPNIRYDTKLTGSGSILRIYRDTRFSKDKTPYKTNLAVVWWEGDGKKMESPSFYFHMAHDDTWAGGGLYRFPDLDQYRRAVDDDVLGPELVEVMAHMTAKGFTPNGEMYKRVPRGYDADHPRGELLKMKGMTCGMGKIDAATITSSDLIDVAFNFYKEMLPMHEWLVKMQQKGD